MKAPAIIREIVIRNRLGLHARAAAQGTTLRLRAAGEDGPAALQALADLVEACFGERE